MGCKQRALKCCPWKCRGHRKTASEWGMELNPAGRSLLSPPYPKSTQRTLFLTVPFLRSAPDSCSCVVPHCSLQQRLTLERSLRPERAGGPSARPCVGAPCVQVAELEWLLKFAGLRRPPQSLCC